MLVLSLFHFFIQLLANKWKYKIFKHISKFTNTINTFQKKNKHQCCT
jgi:hypothetical protein